jgi:hypothetical protein
MVPGEPVLSLDMQPVIATAASARALERQTPVL